MEARVMKSVPGWTMQVEGAPTVYGLSRADGWLCVSSGDGAPLLRVRLDERGAEIEAEGKRYRAETGFEPYACAALPERVRCVSVENGLTMQREAGGWQVWVNGLACGRVRFGLLAHQIALEGLAEPWAAMVFALTIAAEVCESVEVV